MVEEILQVLPRYFRIEDQICHYSTQELLSYYKSLKSTLKFDNIYPVRWMPGVLACPANLKLSMIGGTENVISCGLFPMDASSYLTAMLLQVTSKSTVLDLCCCPGGKYLTLYTQMPSNAILIGVDISKQRLATCQSLLRQNMKYLFSRRLITSVDNNNNNNNNNNNIGSCSSSNSSEDTSTTKNENNNNDNNSLRNIFPRCLLYHADGTVFGNHNNDTSPIPSQQQQQQQQLLFDSYIYLQELQETSSTRGGVRKRRNKSMRAREVKRLKYLQIPQEEIVTKDISENNNNSNNNFVDNYHSSTTSISTATMSLPLSVSAPMETSGSKSGDMLLDDTHYQHQHQQQQQQQQKKQKQQQDHHRSYPSIAIPIPILPDRYEAVLVDAQCTHDASYRHMIFAPPTSLPPSSSLPPGTTPSSQQQPSQPSQSHGPSGVDKNYQITESGIIKLGAYAHTFPNINNNNNSNLQHEGQESLKLELLQRALIRNGFERTLPGGYLIYSTCSACERQCESIVKWLLHEKEDEAELIPIDLSTEKEMCEIFGEKFYHHWLEFCDLIDDNDNKDDNRSNRTPVKDCNEVYYSLSKDGQSDNNDFSLLSSSRTIITDPLQQSSNELIALETCRNIVLNSTTPPLEKDTTLLGTVKLSHLGGVSGLFLAKIKRINI